MRKNGFTLIELLVVIAIMSILTVITVSQFGSAQKRSRDVARKADLNSLSKALLNHYADYGYFPDEDDILWGGEFKDDTDYIYMKVVPRENSSNMLDYCYEVGTPPDRFILLSELENEEDGDYDEYANCGGGYNFAIVSPNAAVSEFE